MRTIISDRKVQIEYEARMQGVRPHMRLIWVEFPGRSRIHLANSTFVDSAAIGSHPRLCELYPEIPRELAQTVSYAIESRGVELDDGIRQYLLHPDVRDAADWIV